MIKILQLDYIQIIKLEPGSYKSSGLAKTELFISKECVSNIFFNQIMSGLFADFVNLVRGETMIIN